MGNYRAALEAMQSIVSNIRKSLVLSDPEQFNLRRELLTGTHIAYEKYLTIGGDDPEVLAGRRDAYRELAGVSDELGNRDVSIRYLREAVNQALRLLVLEPDSQTSIGSTASIQGELALKLSEQGEFLAAESLLDCALEHLEQLYRMSPENPEYQRRMAVMKKYVGLNLSNQGREFEAYAAYENALEVLDELLADGATLQLQLDRLACSTNLAATAIEIGEENTSLVSLQEIVESCQTMLQVPEYQMNYQLWFNRGAALHNLAILNHKLGRSNEALNYLDESEKVWKNSINDFPLRIDFQREHAKAVSCRGLVLESLQRLDEAEQSYLESVRLRAKLRQRVPTDLMTQQEYRSAVQKAANFYFVTGNIGRAAELRSLIEEHVGPIHDTTTADSEAVWLQNLAVSLAQAERWDESAARFKESIALRQRLLELFPDDHRYSVRQAEVIGNYGLNFYPQEDWKNARVQFERALELLEMVQEGNALDHDGEMMLQRFRRILTRLQEKELSFD